MGRIVNHLLTLEKALENYGFKRRCLRNINNFKGMINPMRAYKGATTPFLALFCCAGQVVCVFFTQNTQALKHTISNAQITIAARARNCLSLFFLFEAYYE